jgi:hypothetical protein
LEVILTLNGRAVAALFALALLCVSVPARAADPIFLPGARVGLVPPAGMVASHSFRGFEYRFRQAAIVITEMGAETFSHLEKDFAPEAMKAGGLDFERREDLNIGDAQAFLVTAHQDAGGERTHKWALVLTRSDLTAVVLVVFPDAAKDAYPDAALRAALASVAVRAGVPDEEKLSLLPYRLADLGGFHLVQAIPDGTAVLTLGPADVTVAAAQPFFMIRLASGEPPAPAERESFARRTLTRIEGLDDLKYLQSGPLRIGGEQGFEIIAEATDGKAHVGLTVVQWLRFAPGSNMQMLGIARREPWPEVFPRMRALRDGIANK